MTTNRISLPGARIRNHVKQLTHAGLLDMVLHAQQLNATMLLLFCQTDPAALVDRFAAYFANSQAFLRIVGSR